MMTLLLMLIWDELEGLGETDSLGGRSLFFCTIYCTVAYPNGAPVVLFLIRDIVYFSYVILICLITIIRLFLLFPTTIRLFLTLSRVLIYPRFFMAHFLVGIRVCGSLP